MAKPSQVPVQLELLPQLAPVPVPVDRLLVEQGHEESVEITFYHTCNQPILSQVSGYASDNLDEPEGGDTAGDAMDVDDEDEEEEDEEKPVPTKKRKLTKAAEAKLKAKEKKKKKGSDDEDEDAYTALSKSLWSNGTSKPPVGSFEKCAVCKKQFTVVCLQTFSRRLGHFLIETNVD